MQQDSVNHIYLCKPGGATLGAINGITEENASLNMSVANPWELTFEVSRYECVEDKFEEVPYYNSIGELMELYLDDPDHPCRFVIDAEPVISGDGVNEKKNVTAHSVEYELSSKFLRDFKVNCGVKTSQEYLVGSYDASGNFISLNIDPYTSLPIDYIVVYNDYADTLTNIKTELESIELTIDASTGQITNQEGASLVRSLCEDYPRIGCDIPLEGGDIRRYAHVLGDDVYVDINPSTNTYTKDYLVSGVDNLIAYYQQYGTQLSLVDLAFENAKAAGWSVGDIPESVRHKKFFFDVQKRDILSFFKQECTKTMKVLIDFDRMNRKINIIDIANETNERDTGVFLTFRNLLQSVNVSSSSEDGIKTRFYPTGANNLGILYANFGEPSILNLDWVMDKVDSYGEHQYVSDDLHDKYHRWQSYRYDEPVTITVNGEDQSFDSRRDAYRELTKQYNQLTIDIDTEKDRVPNDGCEIDYTTFEFKELNIAYKAYNNALEALEQLYMSDVGAVIFNRITLEAKDINGNDVTSIRDTMYWYDFQAYVSTIIPNVSTALMQYVNTKGHTYLDSTDPDQYDQEKGEWIQWPGGNPLYNNNAKIVTQNMTEQYLYDMSLYGITELENKKKAWSENAAVLYKPGFVLKNGTVVDPIPADGFTYNTPDSTGFTKLSETQKSEFTGEEAFINALNSYLDYVSTTLRQNSLTKQITKGVIRMAQDKIEELQPVVDAMVAKQEALQTARSELADACALDSWAEFTAEDLATIYRLTKDGDYNNSNILITNLNDIASTVDVQEELYQDSVKALVERSRPQLKFEISSDNLFALEDFKQMADNVKLLNFIRVSIGLYEDEFVKLRVVSITKNPLIRTQNLELQFSNMTYTLQDPSDLAFLFDSMNGSGSSSSSSSNGTGGSGGTYGQNDAEITIANNMLNALLKSKPYAATMGNIVVENIVNNSENVSELMSNSGIFDKLETGDIVVNGKCVTDVIRSSNYDELEKNGSSMNLKDGTFTYADGKLTYDGDKLHVDGSAEIGSMTADGIKTQFDIVEGEIDSAVEDMSQMVESEIKQLPNSITLSVSNGTLGPSNNQASIKVEVTDGNGNTEESSGNITLTGNVVFKDNLDNGTTTISGSSITGGTLTLGGSNNGYGKLSILNSSGSQIGYWNKDGIWASNGEFYGKLSNGSNIFYSDGSFSLGNGALTFNPNSGDQYIHLGSNMSVMYDGIPLAGEDMSSTIDCYGGYLMVWTNQGGGSWSGDGIPITDYLEYMFLKVYRFPNMVSVSLIFELKKAIPATINNKKTELTLVEGFPGRPRSSTAPIIYDTKAVPVYKLTNYDWGSDKYTSTSYYLSYTIGQGASSTSAYSYIGSLSYVGAMNVGTYRSSFYYII